jgi:hypothetical protein
VGLTGTVAPVLAPAFWTTPTDPTGMSSPLGRAVVLVGLLASLVVALRWWWTNRRR